MENTTDNKNGKETVLSQKDVKELTDKRNDLKKVITYVKESGTSREEKVKNMMKIIEKDYPRGVSQE